MTERSEHSYPEELVRVLVATGEEDRDAFSRLYALTSAKLFGICLRICVERQTAEDVLQDVYVTIWRRAAGYEPGRGSPITWLAAIARNRAIDRRRADGRKFATTLDGVPEPIDPATLALDGLLLKERERKLYACLDQLADVQRQAIRTAFFGGFTYTELAEQQGVPSGTMKSWVRRGLLQMRKCLDADV